MDSPGSLPPRLNVPPVLSDPDFAVPQGPSKPKNAFQKAWAGFVAFVLAFWKYVYLAVKLAKGGKLLLTAGTMLLSIGAYSIRFGWHFGVGIVICIFIHEMGHVFAAWKIGMKVSAPIFIPFMGALIVGKQTDSGWKGAILAIGGPAFGAISAFICWKLYYVFEDPFYLGLAYLAFFMNLFNMLPMYPLDGGRIVGAISPYIWIVGMVGLLAMIFTGQMNNPFIYIIMILSIPQIYSMLRRGTMDQTGYRTTGKQKAIMGLAYVSLAAILLFGVVQTQRTPESIQAPVNHSGVSNAAA